MVCIVSSSKYSYLSILNRISFSSHHYQIKGLSIQWWITSVLRSQKLTRVGKPFVSLSLFPCYLNLKVPSYYNCDWASKIGPSGHINFDPNYTTALKFIHKMYNLISNILEVTEHQYSI